MLQIAKTFRHIRLIKDVLEYLNSLAIGNYYEYWQLPDKVLGDTNDEWHVCKLDTIMDYLEKHKFIKWCSESEAKPEEKDPNDANAQYFFLIKSTQELDSKDIFFERLDLPTLKCQSCETVNPDVLLKIENYDIFERKMDGKYKPKEKDRSTGKYKVWCKKCGEEIDIFVDDYIDLFC